MITVGYLFLTNVDDIHTTEPIGAMFYCLFFQMIGLTRSVQIILPIYQLCVEYEVRVFQCIMTLASDVYELCVYSTIWVANVLV